LRRRLRFCVPRLRRGGARRRLAGGPSARRHGRSRRSGRRNGLGHRGRGNYRRRGRHRRRRSRIHDDRRRGQRGREPLNHGRARQVDSCVARRRSRSERVRAVSDRHLHRPAAGALDSPRSDHSRAAHGARRACGAGRSARRRSRRRGRGRAKRRRRDLRKVRRRQRQLWNCGRRGPGIHFGADRVGHDQRVWGGERDRARHGEPEPHPPGAEAIQAKGTRGPEAVRARECRNQPPTHVYTSG